MDIFLLFLGILSLIGIVVGLIMTFSCKHSWVLIEEGKLHYIGSATKRQIGIYKFYECEHCKKLKKETISVD